MELALGGSITIEGTPYSLHIRLPISSMIATKHIEPLFVVGCQFDNPTGVLVDVPAEESPGVVPAVCRHLGQGQISLWDI